MKIEPFVLLVFLIASACCSDDRVETTTEKSDDTAGKTEGEKPLLIVKSVDKEKLPKETQMAQCTVTSGSIKASAQATFSKKLEGFCSTKDMIDLRDTLAALEDRLHFELYNLKLMIQSLMPNSFHQQPQNQQSYYNPHQGFSVPSFQSRNFNRQIPPPPTVRESNDRKSHSDTSTENPKNITAIPSTTEATTTTSTSKTPEVFNVRSNHLKSLMTGKRRSEETTQESITTLKPESVPAVEPVQNQYTYYWKIEKFPKVFHHAKKNEVYSHVFNVKGLFLRMRANLNQHDSDNLLLDIEHLANIENNAKLEVEISDGLVFKEIAEEKLFQYSFAIMDQNRPNHDLISEIYWNTENDSYLIPNSIHLLANYVKNESLLIKLIITF